MVQFSPFAALPPAARWRVCRTFEETGAYSPDKAIAYAPSSRFERRYLERLLDFGAVVEVQPGRYHADATKLGAYIRYRRKRAIARAMVIVGGALALAIARIAKRVLAN
jgi:hypothetical protein